MCLCVDRCKFVWLGQEVATIIQLSFMSQQQPVTPLPLKSMGDQKSINNIRKITIQTLSPIVAKLEEHISYLLEETSKLRNENAKLAIATANQQALERQFGELSQGVDKLSARLTSTSKEKDGKLKEREVECAKLAEQVQGLRKEARAHAKQIAQISDSNEQYLARVEQSKQEQLQSIEQLKARLQNYYEQEMIKIETLGEQCEETKREVASIQQRRTADQEDVKQMMNITALYESERGDIKKIIEKTAFLQNSVVMLQDYQKDKRFQRISNEQTKADIKTMLDEALTPEIRRFLPRLIVKLNDLEQFQATLDLIGQTIKQNKRDQDQKIERTAIDLAKWFSMHQQANIKSFDEVNQKINRILQVLQEKIDSNQQRVNQRLRSVQDELRQLQKRWREGVKQSTTKLQAQLKQYLNVWGDKFLDRKKDNIYQLVQAQKPPEQHKEETRVQQLVFSMEPLLKAVRQELKVAQTQVQSSKDTLHERLSFFNNQIVKIKSDITRETSQTKRILDSFSFKLTENRDTCEELSLMLSKIVETTAISYALSLDQSYLHRDHEVYVTYNDGILLQVTDKGTVSYRRQEYLPQLLKRAVLTELVKIIDSSIINKPLLNWNKNQFKPSHLTPSIQASYQTLLQQNKANIPPTMPFVKSTPLKAPITQRKSLDSKLMTKKQHIIHRQQMGKEIFSRTIDPFDHDPQKFHSATRYDIGYEQSRDYSHRRNVKLKKLDKKQH